ncbi:vitamin K epoxide reductase family protein [Streptomyces sp. XY152]|uniref:vitamin K epoxide reductase family protein n=1 Tax=Streptomyces sp. XY152 TaxID=1415560 RepID=UPI002D21B477|nr:vitamin K epoxide reductase family protein [Streptomyces sp. XY152]
MVPRAVHPLPRARGDRRGAAAAGRRRRAGRTADRLNGTAGTATASGRRIGRLTTPTGAVGRLVSPRLAIDDRRLLEDPDHVPSCDVGPVVGRGSAMASPRGNPLDFPDMPTGPGAFAAVAVLGVTVPTGARPHRAL